MKRSNSLLILFIVMSFVLTSCFGGTETPAPQPTQQNIANMVGVELTVQYDTAVQYNTVGQLIRLKSVIKMLRNDLTDATPPNPEIVGLPSACPAVTTVGNLNDKLETNEIMECLGDYTITQADLDRGTVTLQLSAKVYGVTSNPVTVTIPTVSAKALSITATSDTPNFYVTGQKINLSYTIKNSGSTQLGPGQFTVTETGINNNAPFNCGAADATLAPGASLNCNAPSPYIVTDADMTKGTITTNAVASGGGANPSKPFNLNLTKTTPPANAPGATITHKVSEGEWLWQIARCYGADPKKTVEANPQLDDAAQLKAGMTVTVPNIGSNGTVNKAPCVQMHTVVSGDTWQTIADKYGADLGFLQYVNKNTLTVGKPVKVPLYTKGMNYPLPGTVSTAVPQTSALTISVSANPTTYGQVGQKIVVSYTIKNNGTTNLGPDQFRVIDPLFKSVPFNCGAPNTTLAAGQTIPCTAEYTITQEDLNFNAIVIKPAAGGGGATSPASEITITKSVAQLKVVSTPSSATYNQVGQIITFSYVITNSGNTTLGPDQFRITDILMGAAPFECGNPGTSLAPGQTVTCQRNYTITDSDMTFTAIVNSATATGGGAPPSAADSKTITKQ